MTSVEFGVMHVTQVTDSPADTAFEERVESGMAQLRHGAWRLWDKVYTFMRNWREELYSASLPEDSIV
jgi:hypothetical protein